MATGLELEIAQCIANTPHALDIIFGCVIDASKGLRTSNIGFHAGHDWELMKHFLPFGLQEAKASIDVVDTIRPQFFNVELHWNRITADRIFGDVELLQVLMLDVQKKLPAEAYANYIPTAEHVTAAQVTIERLNINLVSYYEMQISERMDFLGFEKLLATTNAAYADFAVTQIQEAKELLDSRSSQAD